MLKKFALLLILLVPVFAAQALSASIIGITNFRSMYGTCDDDDLLSIDMNTLFTGNFDDGGDNDRLAIVLYDGYGTPLTILNSSFPVGISYSMGPVHMAPQTPPQGRPFTLTVYDTSSVQTAEGAASFPVAASISFDPADFGPCASLPLVESAPTTSNDNDEVVPHFIDGRLNNFDMAAPFAVYGHEFEDGRGLVVYSPEGALLLTVSPDRFAVECTGDTIELASENGVILYLLSSCEYQLMARSLDGTKNYVLIFNSPYPDTGYRSYEE